MDIIKISAQTLTQQENASIAFPNIYFHLNDKLLITAAKIQ